MQAFGEAEITIYVRSDRPHEDAWRIILDVNLVDTIADVKKQNRVEETYRTISTATHFSWQTIGGRIDACRKWNPQQDAANTECQPDATIREDTHRYDLFRRGGNRHRQLRQS